MILPKKEYNAYVTRHIDGDTFECMIDLTFDLYIERRVRLSHIDSFEMNTDLGKEAARVVSKLLPVNAWFALRSDVKVDKFGRTLVTAMTSDGVNVNEELVRLGLAKPYEGGKR